ncbi:MAG: DUF975 family protein [Oscillospiraceae bacterium]|nr:DUF975 family protein [Oscillospiraceae bacterium]
MNRTGLKQAAKQCLQDANKSPTKLTFFFLLCLYGVSLLGDGLIYLLNQNVGTGLSALSSRTQTTFLITVINLVVTLLTAVWTTHYCNYSLKLSRGQETSFQDFLSPFPMVGTVLALLLLTALYTWLWCLLLIVPGLIAAYRYRMARYVIFDQDCSASEAIRESGRLTNGNKVGLFLLDLSFFWYYLPTMLPGVLAELYYLGILDITQSTYQLCTLLTSALAFAVYVWKMPYVEATYAHAFHWMRQEQS